MIKITIAAVGRLKDAPGRALFDDFAGRLQWKLAVREVDLKSPLPGDEGKAAEAKLLLDALPPGCVLVALDEHGQEWDSVEFARRIGRWRDEGIADIAFAIGGADGHGKAVLDRAAATLAFGRMTWPHRLARIMLIEQLYRAQQILAGHPYHRA